MTDITQIQDVTQKLIDSLMPLVTEGMENFDNILASNRKEKTSYFEIVTRLGAESSITVSACFPTYQVLLAHMDLDDQEKTDD